MTNRVSYLIENCGDIFDVSSIALSCRNSHPEIDPNWLFIYAIKDSNTPSDVLEILMAARYPSDGGDHRNGDRVFSVDFAPATSDYSLVCSYGEDLLSGIDYNVTNLLLKAAGSSVKLGAAENIVPSKLSAALKAVLGDLEAKRLAEGMLREGWVRKEFDLVVTSDGSGIYAPGRVKTIPVKVTIEAIPGDSEYDANGEIEYAYGIFQAEFDPKDWFEKGDRGREEPYTDDGIVESLSAEFKKLGLDVDVSWSESGRQAFGTMDFETDYRLLKTLWPEEFAGPSAMPKP